jgi:hypothetical protein
VSRDFAVGIATGYGLDYRGVGVRVPVGTFIFLTSSLQVLGPTQPPIQWVPGAFAPGVSRRGVKLTTHFQLVPRSRIRGYILSISLHGLLLISEPRAELCLLPFTFEMYKATELCFQNWFLSNGIPFWNTLSHSAINSWDITDIARVHLNPFRTIVSPLINPPGLLRI